MPETSIPKGGAAEAVAAVLAERPGATSAELAEAAGVSQSTAAKTLAALEAEGRAARTPGGRAASGRRQPDRWSAPEDDDSGSEPAPAEAPPAEGSQPEGPAPEAPAGPSGTDGRLGRGELASLVLGYLAGRPGEAVGPSAVAKDLGRSAGAVSNALGRLAEAGSVRLVGESPRRYRLARR